MMKKVLKYIVAVLILLTAGISFIPIISLGFTELSAIDIIKMGLGGESGSGIFAEVQELAREYISGSAYLLIILLVIIVVAALLTALLPKKVAYIISIVFQVIINICAVTMYLQVKDKIYEIKSALSFFGIGGSISMQILPVALWVLLYFAAFVLSVLGIAAKERVVQKKRAEDIMPESFHATKNPWEQPSTDRERQYLEHIQRLEEQKKGTVKREKSAVQKSSAKTSGVPGPSTEKFQGAVIGKSGIYQGKAYPMKDRVPVYFGIDGAQIILSEDKMEHVLMKMYYIAEYQEYCVTPEGRKAVFLDSGQPLGASRTYYLPRGMEIYFKQNQEKFTLA